MDFNRKRHKTLKFLSHNRVLFDSGQTENNFSLGKSFTDIEEELNYDRSNCELVFSKLYFDEEVKHTNTSVFGLYLTQKGLDSFTNKKYVKENNKIIVNWFRNFAQIVIPILSLSVAILVLFLKFNSISADIKLNLNKEFKKDFQRLEMKIDSLIQNKEE